MKQKRLVSVIGALTLIISVVVLATGCPQANNNKDNSPTTQKRAVYVGTMEAHGETGTFTTIFYTDGTWIQRADMQGQSVVVMQGTYTGDPSKDGTVSITIKKELNEEGSLVDVAGEDATQSITIAGGKYTVMGVTYTRQ